MNHPQMSSIISNQDEDLLSYMLSLEVSWNCVWAENKGNFEKNKCGQALHSVIITHLEIPHLFPPHLDRWRSTTLVWGCAGWCFSLVKTHTSGMTLSLRIINSALLVCMVIGFGVLPGQGMWWTLCYSILLFCRVQRVRFEYNRVDWTGWAWSCQLHARHYQTHFLQLAVCTQIPWLQQDCWGLLSLIIHYILGPGWITPGNGIFIFCPPSNHR